MRPDRRPQANPVGTPWGARRLLVGSVAILAIAAVTASAFIPQAAQAAGDESAVADTGATDAPKINPGADAILAPVAIAAVEVVGIVATPTASHESAAIAEPLTVAPKTSPPGA